MGIIFEHPEPGTTNKKTPLRRFDVLLSKKVGWLVFPHSRYSVSMLSQRAVPSK